MLKKSLASRIDRFLANFLDGLTLLVILPVILVAALLKLNHALTVFFAYLIIGLAFFIQGYYLSTLGQTFGKKVMKIKVVRYDNKRNGGFITNVSIRFVLGVLLLGMIPFYPLVDFLFIFREDKRCIHNLIAGTCVIDV